MKIFILCLVFFIIYYSLNNYDNFTNNEYNIRLLAQTSYSPTQASTTQASTTQALPIQAVVYTSDMEKNTDKQIQIQESKLTEKIFIPEYKGMFISGDNNEED